jgi:hypothetical protein
MDEESGSVGIWLSTTSRYGACYKFVTNCMLAVVRATCGLSWCSGCVNSTKTAQLLL